MSSPPTKSERERCWRGKDAYWKCLDDNDNDESKCTQLHKQFEQSCSKQWFKYFERRREYLKFKDKIDQGFDPTAEQNSS